MLSDSLLLYISADPKDVTPGRYTVRRYACCVRPSMRGRCCDCNHRVTTGSFSRVTLLASYLRHDVLSAFRCARLSVTGNRRRIRACPVTSIARNPRSDRTC